MILLKSSLILLCSFVCLADSYRILHTVLGVSGSHNLLVYRFAEYLASRDNNIAILRHVIASDAPVPHVTPNVTEYINEVYTTSDGGVRRFDDKLQSYIWDGPFDGPNLWHLQYVTLHACESLLRNRDLITRLNQTRFDVIIIHAMDKCAFGLAHVLGIRSVAWFATSAMLDYMSLYGDFEFNPSWVVSSRMIANDHMALYERLVNLLRHVTMRLRYQYSLIPKFDRIFKKFRSSQLPPLSELIRRTSLYLISADSFWELPRPIGPNVVYIGGLTMATPPPLPLEWISVVNREEARNHGIVIFSFGTMVNVAKMPAQDKAALLRAFASIPHLVIWHTAATITGSEKVPNVLITDWIPQRELLAHPQTKAILTHGGYNTITEAHYLGTPLIVIPLAGDQFGNSLRVVRAGTGVVLDKEHLTSDQIGRALREVLYNESYMTQSRKLSRMIQSRPNPPAKSAGDWVEFLAEFGPLTTTREDTGQRLWKSDLPTLTFVLATALMTVALMAVWRYIKRFL